MPLLVLLACYLFAAHAVAAAPASGERWQQIQQPQFNLIFQAKIVAEAERVADALNQYLANHLSEMPLDRPIRPFSLVLHANAHSSNGYVGLRPYRSNWYNKPAAFSGLEWYDTLAVHEGRHLIQFNQLNDLPLARAARVITGDTGLAAFAVVALPNWFLEGDAVVAETTQTQAGRGRRAAFDLWFRTDALSHAPYSYERAMLGTGFDRVPYLSPYLLGYYFTAYLRTEYGSDLFDRVIGHLGRWPGFTFNGAIELETGEGLAYHYQAMMTQLRRQWQQQLDALSLTPVTVLSTSPGDHWQSLYPLALADDGVLAAQVDAAEGNFLVKIQAQQVTRLTAIPNDVARSFSSESKTRVISSTPQRSCWIAEIPDRRKPLMATGELVCWQHDTGLVQLTQGEKLTAVAQSAEGFVAHRFTSARTSELVLLGPTGQQLNSIRLAAHSLAHDIKPTADGWIFVLTGSDRNGIYQVAADLSGLVRLKGLDQETVRSPLLTKNWLVYQSDRTGIDQLMARSRSTGKEYQISSRPFGSYYPLWDPRQQRLVFADYRAQGQQVVSVPFFDSAAPQTDWQAAETLPRAALYAQALIRPPVLVPERTQALERSDYPVMAQLWNPHSWWINLENDLLMGTIHSDDALGKLSLTASAGYYLAADDWLARLDAQYRTAPGPTLGVLLDRQLLANLLPSQSAAVGVSQVFTDRRGAYRAQWTPSLALQLTQAQGSASTSALLAQLQYGLAHDRPPHSLANPVALDQRWAARSNLAGTQFDGVSQTGLTVPGLSRRHAVDLGVDAQALQSNAPLLLDSRLFGPADALGLTLRSGINYRLNLGAVGQTLTSLAYWRNTQVALNGRAQYADDQWQSALGITLQPSLNLLRNSNLLLSPSLALYRLQNDSLQLNISISLGGF